MHYLTTIRTALNAALTAVSSRIGSLLEDERRFPAEFYVPALAFSLACLAVLMAILGPEAPRRWWDNLPTDLKLLAGVLAGLLLILLAETSRSLVATVRRLYSGEWPSWPLWNPWRKEWLLERQSRAEIAGALSDAYGDFSDAVQLLEDLGAGPAVAAQEKRSFTVPRGRIAPFQLIGADDVVRLSLDGGQAPADAVLWPEAIIGRYAVQELAPRRPVAAGLLRSLPAEEYLDQNRSILTLTLTDAEASTAILQGDIVTLWINRRGSPLPHQYEDLFVLDRPQPGQVVLSVQTSKLQQLLRDLQLRAGVAFTALSQAPTTLLTGVPIARQQVRRGQLIQESDLTWKRVERDLAQADDPTVYDSQEVLGHLYMPDGVQAVLASRTPFEDSWLRTAGGAQRWLLYDEGGHRRSRLAVRVELCAQAAKQPACWQITNLALTTDDTARLKAWALNGEFVALMEPSMLRLESGPEPRAPHYVGAGDVLDLLLHDGTFEDVTLYEQCYVYGVVAGSATCTVDLAVKDPATFQQLLAGKKVLASPYGRIPVLRGVAAGPGSGDAKAARRWMGEGQLVSEADLAYVEVRRGRLPAEICTSFDQVKDHFVVRGARLVEGLPIACDALDSKLPPNPRYLSLQRVRAATSGREQARIEVEGSQLPQRGDLVTLRLEEERAAEPAGRRLEGPWTHVLVTDARYQDPANGRKRRDTDLLALTVVLPASEHKVAKAAWESGQLLAKVRVTHNDALVDERLSAIAAQEPGPEQMTDELNALLSSASPDAEEVTTLSRAAKSKATALVRLHSRMLERPWQDAAKSPPSQAEPTLYYQQQLDAGFWQQLLLPYRRALAPWPDNVIYQLKDQADKADQLVLPDKEADTKPTEMGNVLTAAADYPWSAYTIDTSTILPRLVQVLDSEDGAYKRLRSAESSLNMVLMFSFWSLVWTVLGSIALLAGGGSWIVFLIVLVGGALLWWLTKEAATTQAYAYGDALKALFDLKRRELLSAMGVQLSEEERHNGMTPADEGVYWLQLYRLFALGNSADAGFPRLKPGEDE